MEDFNKRIRRYVMYSANEHVKIYKKHYNKYPHLRQNIDISLSNELKRMWKLAKRLTKDYTDINYKFYTD